MSRRPARCTQADIARALKAADQAGVHHVVEILPDGTIRLIPANQASPEPIATSRKIVL